MPAVFKAWTRVFVKLLSASLGSLPCLGSVPMTQVGEGDFFNR